MSLILDALNRADRDRKEQDHIPSLQTVHGASEQQKPSLRQRLHLERWLVLVVIGYLVYDYVKDRDAGVEPDPVPPVQQAPATPAPAAEPVSQPPMGDGELKPAREQPSAPPPPVETSSLEDEIAVPVEAVASLYSEPRTSQQASPEKVSTTPAVAAAQAPPEPAEPAEPIESEAGEETLSGRELAFNLVLEITDLDKEFRRQVPTLKYSNHQPAAEPGNSRVVINDSVYKEGDQVAPGLVLRQISRQGIVLEFQGTRFKLPAYNSWINFPGS